MICNCDDTGYCSPACEDAAGDELDAFLDEVREGRVRSVSLPASHPAYTDPAGWYTACKGDPDAAVAMVRGAA